MTEQATPSHLVHLTGGWSMWRWVWLRSTGFPAREVLALADLDLVEAADLARALEVEAADVRERAIAELKQRAPTKELHRAIVQLSKGRLPNIPDPSPSLTQLVTLSERLATARAEVDQAHAKAVQRIGQEIRRVATNPRFREAVLWQNRGAVRRGIDWLLAHPELSNTEARKKQRMIASYLQRYCLKNDTIGFFGPIGWAELHEEAVFAVEPGSNLLAQREAYLEHWAIDAVADAMSADAALKRFLAPRLVSSATVRGDTLLYGIDRELAIEPALAKLLTACDGQTPAHVVARRLVEDPTTGLDTEEEVLETLDDLARKKLVVWSLEVSALTHPERKLRKLLEGVAAPEVRQPLLDGLSRLERARAEIAAAAGNPERLDAALEQLDQALQELSGQQTTRNAGKTYAARTPMYEDCVRDISVQIGRPVLDRLAPVLHLVGHSARWFTHEVASRFRAALHERYAALEKQVATPVHYPRFWREVQSLFPEQRQSDGISAHVERELQARWASILQLDMTQHRVERSAAQLADRVMSTFDAPSPGWPGARHLSPDVLIAARGADAISRGELTIVLGELHPGNSMLTRCVIPHGPGGDDRLMRACEVDLAPGRVSPAEQRDRVTRADAITWSAHDFDVEIATSRSWRPRDQVLRAADLVVERAGTTLAVRHLPSGRRFDIIAFLETYLLTMVLNHFKPAPRGSHVPRVTIDDVVLCREQWTFDKAELAVFRAEPRSVQEFSNVRAWTVRHGIPRWAFAKVPEEPKPVFVDFASPIYVEILAKMARDASSLSLTEMLPTIEETWLPDIDGQTYATELRMVAVDPVRWANPLDHDNRDQVL